MGCPPPGMCWVLLLQAAELEKKKRTVKVHRERTPVTVRLNRHLLVWNRTTTKG